MRKTLEHFQEVYEFFTGDLLSDVTDDNSPGMFTVVKKILTNDIVLMPSCGSCFVFRPINSVLYEVHYTLSKQGLRGIKEDSLRVMNWLSANTQVESVMSLVPETYEKAYKLCVKMGLKCSGVIHKSFAKNSELIGCFIMSASIEEIRKGLSCQ